MKKKQYKPKNDIFIYMLAVLIFVVPLIVFLKVDTLPKDLAEIIGTETYADLFAYYKAHVLQIGALIMFVLAIGYRFYHEKSFKPDTFVWLLIAFATSILLSYAFSEHKEVALRGAFERYEGTLTWLSYVALSYSVYTFVEKKSDAYILIGAFVMSATVVSLIGVFQYFGMDLFRTEFGKKLMLGSYYEQAASSLEFKMEKGRVYSTLYNPNYVGSMIALAFPLTVYLMDELRKKWVLVLGAGIIVLEMITLVGSRSAGGFFGVAFSVLLMAFYFAWKHPKRKVLIPLVCIGLVIGAVGAYQVPYVNGNVKKIVSGLGQKADENFPVKDIRLEKNTLQYILRDESWFKLTPVNGQVEVEILDESQNQTFLMKDSENKTTRLLAYEIIMVKNSQDGSFRTRIEDLKSGRKTWLGLDLYQPNCFSIRGHLVDTDNLKAKKVNWFKNESGFTNRGYIWNRSMPLIFKKPVFGYGADNFVLQFPKVDLLARSQFFFEYNILVDKPHNMYVQYLINFGFVGALLYLVLVFWCFNRKTHFLIIITVLGFLLVSLVNDSVPYISMMIFVLFGLQAIQNKAVGAKNQ